MVTVLLIAALIIFIVAAWMAGANTWARLMAVGMALLTLTQMTGILPGLA